MRLPAYVLALSVLLAGASSPSPALAQDASIKSRLDARGIKYEVDEDGDFKVTYNYSKQGRTQLVFVSGHREEVGGLRVLNVFSPAARIGKDGIGGAKAMELLRESSNNKLGSWEVSGDLLYFVVKVADNGDAGQLETVMDIAAETADDMEMEISGDRDDL